MGSQKEAFKKQLKWFRRTNNHLRYRRPKQCHGCMNEVGFRKKSGDSVGEMWEECDLIDSEGVKSNDSEILRRCVINHDLHL